MYSSPTNLLLAYMVAQPFFKYASSFQHLTVKKWVANNQHTLKDSHAPSGIRGKYCMLEVCSEREIHCSVTACSLPIMVRCSNLDKALVDNKSWIVERKDWHEQFYVCSTAHRVKLKVPVLIALSMYFSKGQANHHHLWLHCWHQTLSASLRECVRPPSPILWE
jgi:hypothetical protein